MARPLGKPAARSGRRPRLSRRTLRRLNLLGCAVSSVALCLASIALAEDAAPASASTPAKSGGGAMRQLVKGGQTHTPLLFAADDVTYDNQLSLVIARGNVQITQNGRTLVADTVSYNQLTDTVVASGHVSLTDPDGTVVFGDYVKVTNDLHDGFIRNIRMLMTDRSRMAGNAGLRTDGNRTELAQGVYSPCDLCKDDPTRPPIWQIKAARIIHDETNHEIIYHDAKLEIAGVPVLYTPYLSTPDPTVKRKSGFLVPSIGSSEELGGHALIPYYWAIAPDKDFLFEPLISTKEGVLLAGRYRQRFANGTLSLFASGTDALNGTDSAGNNTGRSQLRGNIDARGDFDLTDTLRTNFQIERASDQTYTRVYSLGTWDSFLTTHAGLEKFDGRNYGSLDAYAFQSLRDGLEDKYQPVVAPVLNYTWYGRPNNWGSKFTTNLNVLNLLRESGTRTQRTSVGTELDRPFTTSNGQLFNTFVAARGDAYYIAGYHATGAGNNFNGGAGRVFPQVGADWRYPFARRFEHSTMVVEPRAAFYASTVGGNPLRIPDNDSMTFEFNDADLFQRDRLYGYDLVDSGQRVDYALHATWHADNGYHSDALFGQSYRFQKTAIFGPGTGLEHQRSDYVGRVTFSPNEYVDLGYHFRVSEHSFQLEHQDVSAGLGPYYLRLNVGYIQLNNNARDQQNALKQVTANVNIWANDYWSFNLGTVRNLGSTSSQTSYPSTVTTPLAGQLASNSLSNSISVSYTDECMTFRTSFVQSGIRDRDVKPGDAVLFQLVFKNLGEVDLPSIKSGGS